jgi:hypothetical protein
MVQLIKGTVDRKIIWYSVKKKKQQHRSFIKLNYSKKSFDKSCSLD